MGRAVLYHFGLCDCHVAMEVDVGAACLVSLDGCFVRFQNGTAGSVWMCDQAGCSGQL